MSILRAKSQPGTKDYVLSPPLLPYSPACSQYTLVQEDIHLTSLAATNFDDDLLLSSQSFWDQFPSPSPGFIENMTQNIDHKSSPAQVVDTETKFIFNLRLDTPLTPQPLKRPVEKYGQEFQQGFRNLKLPVIPLSPETPGKDSLQTISRLESMFANETFSAESSLYLPIPHIPPPSPKESPFPMSLFGIFVAGNGLQCDEILRSALDAANDEIKWQPFIKPSRTIDTWSEELEGDWESYVDLTSSSNDKDYILKRSIRDEKEELLEIRHQRVTRLTVEESEGFTDVLAIVRKRKAEAIEAKTSRERKTTSGWSQQNQIDEYMISRGWDLRDMSIGEVQEKVMIRMLQVSVSDI